MAAFPFLFFLRGFLAAPVTADAVREVVFLDTQLQLRDRFTPVAQWRRDADGRLVCGWVRPMPGQIRPR